VGKERGLGGHSVSPFFTGIGHFLCIGGENIFEVPISNLGFKGERNRGYKGEIGGVFFSKRF